MGHAKVDTTLRVYHASAGGVVTRRGRNDRHTIVHICVVDRWGNQRLLSQAEIARREGITRARVTQVMGMLRLAPWIQQHILSMPDMVHRPAISERTLRPIAKMKEREDQTDAFSELFDRNAT